MKTKTNLSIAEIMDFVNESDAKTQQENRRFGLYNDGDYQATSSTPWGDVSIDITVSNGRWSNIKYLQLPDSPPSQYAASYLANQALAAQGASVDGVSGATYFSDAFRDDLNQIVQQSKA